MRSRIVRGLIHFAFRRRHGDDVVRVLRRVPIVAAMQTPRIGGTLGVGENLGVFGLCG